MKTFLRILKYLTIGFFALTYGLVILYRFVPIYATPLMAIRTFEAWTKGEKAQNEKEWVPLEKISPQLIRAVIASEDNLFLEHHGFSIDAIKKAVEHNKKKKRIHGGSTISQQTAKNVFLTPHRSFLRKGFEIYFTALIELFWGKERIMEVYLNVIEMGNGIYGAEAASKNYFHCSAENLTASQASLIAACLPNPRRYKVTHPSLYVLRRQEKILSLMPKMGSIEFGKKE